MEEFTPQEIAKSLHLLRHAKGWTLRQLEKESGVAVNTICAYKSRRRRAPPAIDRVGCVLCFPPMLGVHRPLAPSGGLAKLLQTLYSESTAALVTPSASVLVQETDFTAALLYADYLNRIRIQYLLSLQSVQVQSVEQPPIQYP